MDVLPNTINGLLVLACAVLPGIAGDRIYRAFVGSDWREDVWARVIRLLAFSVFGLSLYALSTRWFAFPAPTYLIASDKLSEAQLTNMLVAALGQFAAASIGGALAVLAGRLMARLSAASTYPFAWDQFVKECAKSHWVVVGLSSGESYMGYIDVADVSVGAADRDLVLRDACVFDPKLQTYVGTPFQSIFLPGASLISISVVTDSTQDKRLVAPGELVNGDTNEKGKHDLDAEDEKLSHPNRTLNQAVHQGVDAGAGNKKEQVGDH